MAQRVYAANFNAVPGYLYALESAEPGVPNEFTGETFYIVDGVGKPFALNQECRAYVQNMLGGDPEMIRFEFDSFGNVKIIDGIPDAFKDKVKAISSVDLSDDVQPGQLLVVGEYSSRLGGYTLVNVDTGLLGLLSNLTPQQLLDFQGGLLQNLPQEITDLFLKNLVQLLGDLTPDQLGVFQAGVLQNLPADLYKLLCAGLSANGCNTGGSESTFANDGTLKAFLDTITIRTPEKSRQPPMKYAVFEPDSSVAGGFAIRWTDPPACTRGATDTTTAIEGDLQKPLDILCRDKPTNSLLDSITQLLTQ